MFCPKCGTENVNGAKFCKSCGNSLNAMTPNGGTSTMPTKPFTASAPGTKPDLKMPSKPVLIGSVVAVVTVVAIAVLIIFGGGIGEREFRAALQDSKLLTIQKGEFNDESQLNIDSVRITSREKAAGDDAALARMLYGTDELYEVVGDVKLSNDEAEVNETVTLYFAKENNKWAPVGSPDVENAVWTAKQGPSEEKVSENAATIISQALSGTGYGSSYSEAPDKARATSSSYSGADISIGDSRVDGNQATTTLNVKRSGSYYSFGGSIRASFTFDNGRWALDSAKTDDAQNIDFSGIVGTWSGTCSSAANNCSGAEGKAVSITITSVDSSTGDVSGTISCLAHFHGSDGANKNSDTMLTDAPFTAKLTTAGGLNLDCKFLTLKHDTGKMAASLSFSSNSNDGDKVGITISTADDRGWPIYRDDYTLDKAA